MIHMTLTNIFFFNIFTVNLYMYNIFSLNNHIIQIILKTIRYFSAKIISSFSEKSSDNLK